MRYVLQTLRKRRGAFSLIELLVVVAIIAVLVAMLLPNMRGLKRKAYQMTCAKNLKVLTAAYLHFSTDNNSALISSNTSGGTTGTGGGQFPDVPYWVQNGNAVEAIENGGLFPYVKEVKSYKCPNTVRNRFAHRTSGGRPLYDYYNTYSMNGRLRGERNRAWVMSQVTEPSSTFLLMEEADPRGWNINSWFINSRDQWVDRVLGNHDDGTGDNVVFVDGHIEFWQWEDPDTLRLDSSPFFGFGDPGSVDLKKIWEHHGPE